MIDPESGAAVGAGIGRAGRAAPWADATRSGTTRTRTRRPPPWIDGVRYSIPGDFATVEADGSIRLLGRGSVCINTGGEKVFPEEVEEASSSSATVRDAVAVGIPDERFGEMVTAAVELWPGPSATEDETHRPRAQASWPPTRRPGASASSRAWRGRRPERSTTAGTAVKWPSGSESSHERRHLGRRQWHPAPPAYPHNQQAPAADLRPAHDQLRDRGVGQCRHHRDDAGDRRDPCGRVPAAVRQRPGVRHRPAVVRLPGQARWHRRGPGAGRAVRGRRAGARHAGRQHRRAHLPSYGRAIRRAGRGARIVLREEDDPMHLRHLGVPEFDDRTASSASSRSPRTRPATTP